MMRTTPSEPNDLQRQKRKTIPCPSGRPPSRPHRGLSHHHYHKSHHRTGGCNSVVACSGDMFGGEANARSLLALRRRFSKLLYTSADVILALVHIQAPRAPIECYNCHDITPGWSDSRFLEIRRVSTSPCGHKADREGHNLVECLTSTVGSGSQDGYTTQWRSVILVLLLRLDLLPS